MAQTNMELLKQFINASEILVSNEYYELFSSEDNVKDIMEYVSPPKDEWEEEEEEKKKHLREFAHKLYVTGLQIPFLRAVIIYISDHLVKEAYFSDYEHAIRYSCIAAAGLKDLKMLNETEREAFFENMLIGIRYAGERGQRGYAYEGREEIRRYAFLLTGELTKEIAKRNYVLDADSVIKRITNGNMVYFVSNSCMTEKEKEKYRKIDGLLASKCYASLGLLTDSLEQIFGEYVLSGFEEKEMEEWQHIIELQEEHTKDRVCVRGKLDVWHCSIQYRIVYKQHNSYSLKQMDLEYGIDLENDKEFWRDIGKSKRPIYLGEISQNRGDNNEIQDVMNNYLADWSQRSISGSMMKRGLEVQCFWHDRIQERDVDENIIKVKGCPYIAHEKVDNKHIFIIDPPQKKTVQNKYWINNADSEVIKSINILLGRNGSGKTSTMMMLRYDGLEVNAKESLTKFFIVYKRGEDYFYSTNLGEEEYDLKGEVLKKGRQNISEYRGQKNKVIYYSNFLQPYEERMELMASNTVDISSQYIRDMEIGGLSRDEMIHTAEINDRDRKFRLKHKQDYNQDVLRQLHFLYDTLLCDTNDKKESWRPNYVKKFVLMRFDLKAECKIDDRISNNELKKDITGFWEYGERRVYYQNKNELKKIIDICEEMIEDEELLYFEVCLPQMSSGEKTRLTLLSRLHAWISKMTFSDLRQNNVLLLDELEAYMHPEWQRRLIYNLISFFEWEHSIGNSVKVQLFISSNSPFLISDVDIDEITVMNKDDIEVKEKTFAQNIHVILKDSFFKNNGSMGEYAKQKVDRAYKILTDCLEDNSGFERNVQAAEECNNIIEKIGEPLIYKDLWEMYEEVFGKEEKNTKSEKRISEMSDDELRQQMKAVQEELKRRRK